MVVWLGLRERREWLRAGGALLFAIAIARLISLQFSPPPIDQLVLLNRRAGLGTYRFPNDLQILARPAGLEPGTPGLEGRCAIQVNYGRAITSSRSDTCNEGFRPEGTR